MKIVKNILDKITSYASVFIFIMMVLMVTYQVVARYIFSFTKQCDRDSYKIFIRMVDNYICNLYVWTERTYQYSSFKG